MPLIKFEVLFQCKLIFSKGLGYLGGGDIFLLTTGFLDHFYLVCLLIWFDLNLPPWFFICPSVFCFLSLLFLSSFGLSIFMILFYLLCWLISWHCLVADLEYSVDLWLITGYCILSCYHSPSLAVFGAHVLNH